MSRSVFGATIEKGHVFIEPPIIDSIQPNTKQTLIHTFGTQAHTPTTQQPPAYVGALPRQLVCTMSCAAAGDLKHTHSWHTQTHTRTHKHTHTRTHTHTHTHTHTTPTCTLWRAAKAAHMHEELHSCLLLTTYQVVV